MKKGWDQGCQMVCFQTKNPNSGRFRRALDWKMFIHYGHLEYLWRVGVFYDHLTHFAFIWYIFTVLVSCTKKIWQPRLRYAALKAWQPLIHRFGKYWQIIHSAVQPKAGWPGANQGCQMLYFQTKNNNLGKFLEGLGVGKVRIVYSMAIWNVYITAIWNILWAIGN
jgi:hypothetical protein